MAKVIVLVGLALIVVPSALIVAVAYSQPEHAEAHIVGRAVVYPSAH